MSSVEEIFEAKRILVLGGSPREVIDGVRHYVNLGRDQTHGAHTAQALLSLGAKVTLITAKSPLLPVSSGLTIIDAIAGRKIVSTEDLLAACTEQPSAHYDLVVQLANIPTIVPAQQSDRKLKVKNLIAGTVPLEVLGNVDVVEELRRLFPESVVVGYNNRHQWVSVGDGALSQNMRGLADQARGEAFKRPSRPITLPSVLKSELKGRKVIITSGPTDELLTNAGDAITNFSSGRQGHAVAEALACMGAEVVLVSGPTDLARPACESIRTIDAGSAQEMHDAVISELPADVFVGVAAVADFGLPHPVTFSLKEGEAGTLQLRQNPDILQAVGTHPSQRPSVVVGFAAETHDLLKYARDKLKRKGADFICANQVGDLMAKRSSSMNSITFVTISGDEELQEIPKIQVGEAIGRKIVQLLAEKSVRHE